MQDMMQPAGAETRLSIRHLKPVSVDSAAAHKDGHSVNVDDSNHLFGTDTPPTQVDVLCYRRRSSSSGSLDDPGRQLPAEAADIKHHQQSVDGQAVDEGSGTFADQAARCNSAQHTHLAPSKSELLALLLRNFRHYAPASGLRQEQGSDQPDTMQPAALQGESADTLHDRHCHAAQAASPPAAAPYSSTTISACAAEAACSSKQHLTAPAGWTAQLLPPAQAAAAEEFDPWLATCNLPLQDYAAAAQLGAHSLHQQEQEQERPSAVAGVAAMFLESLATAFTTSSALDSQQDRLAAMDDTMYDTSCGPLSGAALQAYEELKAQLAPAQALQSGPSTDTQQAAGELLAEVFPPSAHAAVPASQGMGMSHPLSTGFDMFGSPCGIPYGSPYSNPFVMGCGSEYASGLMSAYSYGSLMSGHCAGIQQLYGYDQHEAAPFGYGQHAGQVAFEYMAGSHGVSIGQHSTSSPSSRRRWAPAAAARAASSSPARGHASKLTAGRGGNVRRTPVAPQALNMDAEAQSPFGSSVFPPTERWMRELRETVDVDTQNRIRQDWLARPEPKELAVTCKGVEALFFVDATTKRCKIKTLDGRIISPNEFEAECGAGNSKAWLQSIVARDYKSTTFSYDGHVTLRSICLGHFTRLVNIDTSRKPQCVQQAEAMQYAAG